MLTLPGTSRCGERGWTVLFSVPVHTWWLTAAAATLVLMITMERFSATGLDEAPEELRARAEDMRRTAVRVVFAGFPALFSVVALLELLNGEREGLYLFLYSVTAVSMPVALLPFRRRMYRHHFAQLLSGEEITMDRVASVWLCTALLVPVLAASALLATAGGTS